MGGAAAAWLLTTPEGQALLAAGAGALVSVGASIVNAVIPNEGEDASAGKRVFGKFIRALSLTVGEAVAKKKE